MALGDAAFSNADIMRRMKAFEDRQREQAGGHRLESSTIGKGGLRVKGEGGITLQNGGGLHVEDGGSAEIRDGGGLTVFDGGTISARYTDGSNAVLLGPIYAGDVLNGHGFFVQDNLEGGGRDIFRARRLVDGTRLVSIGQTGAGGVPEGIDQFQAWSEFFSVFTTANINLLADAFATIESGTGNLFLRSTGNDVNVQADGGSIWLQSLNNATHIEHVVDTGLAANCHIGGDGRIWSTASSARYKTDIADAQIEPNDVLRLRPRVWRDKTSESPGVGFIAEEVAEIPGMDQFVVYDDEGPQSIAYDRLTAALVPVVQRQQQQIDDLTATVGALVERIEALEASP